MAKSAASKTTENSGSALDLTYSMSYSKATPGTYVYVADDPDAFVTQLYIKKAGMPNGNLPSITITVK